MNMNEETLKAYHWQLQHAEYFLMLCGQYGTTFGEEGFKKKIQESLIRDGILKQEELDKVDYNFLIYG